MEDSKIDLTVLSVAMSKVVPKVMAEVMPKVVPGFTLIECMVIIGLLGIFLTAAGGFSSQIYASYTARNLVHSTAQAFFQDAQRVRMLARTHKMTFSMLPQCNNAWESGWIIIQNPHLEFNAQAKTKTKIQVISYHRMASGITTVRPRGSPVVTGTQFADVAIKSHQHVRCASNDVANETTEKLRHISFNAVGSAQTKNGGFVANRVVFWSKKFPNIEYHVVLGGGGRIRLCQPQAINPKCSLSF